MSDSPLIIDLAALDPNAINAEHFGGKALGLARLCHAGLPTPAGFAVSASTKSPEEAAIAALARAGGTGVYAPARGTKALHSCSSSSALGVQPWRSDVVSWSGVSAALQTRSSSLT